MEILRNNPLTRSLNFEEIQRKVQGAAKLHIDQANEDDDPDCVMQHRYKLSPYEPSSCARKTGFAACANDTSARGQGTARPYGDRPR
jgi:hypothetical protein